MTWGLFIGVGEPSPSYVTTLRGTGLGCSAFSEEHCYSVDVELPGQWQCIQLRLLSLGDPCMCKIYRLQLSRGQGDGARDTDRTLSQQAQVQMLLRHALGELINQKYAYIMIHLLTSLTVYN